MNCKVKQGCLTSESCCILLWLAFTLFPVSVVTAADNRKIDESQQKEVKAEMKGYVGDENGEPVIGATVLESGTQNGVITDVDGIFTIQLAKNASLTISYVGYQKKTVVVKDKKFISVNLTPDRSMMLDEVVVVGFGKQKKESLVGAVQAVKPEDLKMTSSNLSTSFAGNVPGIIAVQTQGEPGSDEAKFYIRGISTFGSNTSPLIILDGVEINATMMNNIPPESIASFSVLKDATATSLYGSRGANGVIIVTTKQGQLSEKMSVDIRFDNTFSMPTYVQKMADGPTYMDMYNEAVYNQAIANNQEYEPKYLDVNYSYGSFNTHNASVVSKMNIAPKGIEFGLGGFYTYADNDYKMKSPFQEGLTITRDHDKFKKTVIGGSFKARKWWFDLVEFEPVFIHTYKDIQGIESNIRHAHSHSNAFIFANKMEKENFLLDGLDLDWQLGYIYTDYHFADTASHRTHWDGTHYPAVSEFGGEIGKWASLLTNEKHQLQHKLNLNYLVNENHSVNFNSLLKYAHANPRDGMKDKVIGYRTDFPSNMFSWVAGLNYDYRTSNDKFLNSFNVKYYYYSMKTRMASVLVKTAEDIDTHKNDFGISNALRYRITPSLMAKASFGYDVRLPSEEELLGDGYVIAPAGNLTPERNISVNIGMLFDLTGKASSNLQIELNGYYMHLKDMIRFTGGFLQSQYQNFGEMRTLGMEAEVKADMTRWLYGYVNATYQDLRDVRKYEQNTTVANPTKGSRMPNIPYLMANAGLEFHKENLFGGSGMNTRIFTDASFVEEYLYDFEQSQFQQHRIPRALSCNIGFEQSFGNGRYFIMGKINNLTDTKMISEFNRPLPGRSFTIRFRYVFK